MNDLEICVRIAKIENLFDRIVDEVEEQRIRAEKVLQTGAISYFKLQSFEEIYSPLKCDAICFQLMVKHKINFEVNDSESIKNGWGLFKTFKQVDGHASQTDNNPNKAICLAIINDFN